MSIVRMVEYIVAAVVGCFAGLLFLRLWIRHRLVLSGAFMAMCFAEALEKTLQVFLFLDRFAVIDISTEVTDIMWTVSASGTTVAMVLLCTLLLFSNKNGSG